MKILHYTPKEQKIRFFREARRVFRELFKDEFSISDNQYLYNSFHDSNEFLKNLRNRVDYPDISLIMAHGWKNSILKTVKGNYEKDITIDKANLFANNFVFALSCYTAKEFGVSAIDNNALVYIGFDDSIENFFEVDDGNYKKLSKKLEIVIKRLYMKCFINEFKKFVTNCYTAIEFYKYLSLRINKEISKLLKMPLDEMNKIFEINIRELHAEKARKIIKLQIIAKVDEINKKMKFMGEESYIPWYYLSDQTNERLSEILEKTEQIDEKYNNYKYFIKALVYKNLNDDENYRKIIEEGYDKCNKQDQCFYYYKLYQQDEVAAGQQKN